MTVKRAAFIAGLYLLCVIGIVLFAALAIGLLVAFAFALSFLVDHPNAIVILFVLLAAGVMTKELLDTDDDSVVESET